MSCLYTASEGLNNLPLSQPLISKSALLEINSGFHPFLERFEADFQPFEAILCPLGTMQAHLCLGLVQPRNGSRACSAVTQQVNAFVGKKVNVHSHLQRKLSGQLPFLGST